MFNEHYVKGYKCLFIYNLYESGSEHSFKTKYQQNVKELLLQKYYGTFGVSI
jgi:hypothetical protein